MDEPTLLAVSASGRVAAHGEAAPEAVAGHDGLKLISPVRDGAIADFSLTVRFVERVLASVCGPRRFLRPTLGMTVPSEATSVERRAATQALQRAGAGRAVLLEAPLAAGLGAGCSINQPEGALVVHLGAGTSEVALLSMRTAVTCKTLRLGGDSLDEAIQAHVRSAHGLQIGRRTAEQVKVKLGCALPRVPELRTSVTGRDLLSGAPRAVDVSSEEIRAAMAPLVGKIVHAVWAVLERTPPELGSDVMERGLTMTGAGSLLHGLDQLLAESTDLQVRVADNPAHCAVIGLGMVLEHQSAQRASLW